MDIAEKSDNFPKPVALKFYGKDNSIITLIKIFAGEDLQDPIELNEDIALSLHSFSDAFRHATDTELTDNFGDSKDVKKFYRNLLLEEDVKPFLAAKLFWVRAFINNNLVGWMSFQADFNAPNIVYLSTLVIAPEFQSLGIGKILINSITEHWSPATREVRLVVRKINNNAIGFYHHLGFVEDANIPAEEECNNCIWMRWIKES